MLCTCVGGVGQDHLAILVLLGFPHQGHQFLLGVALAFSVFVKEELLGPLGKLLVGQHAILYEHTQIVPLGLKGGAVLFEHLAQLVADLFADVP